MVIEIVNFPINSMVIVHSYIDVSHYQRVNPIQKPLNHNFPMVFLWFNYQRVSTSSIAIGFLQTISFRLSGLDCQERALCLALEKGLENQET